MASAMFTVQCNLSQLITHHLVLKVLIVKLDLATSFTVRVIAAVITDRLVSAVFHVNVVNLRCYIDLQ